MRQEDDKQSSSIIGNVPLIVGAVVFLCTKAAAWVSFWISQNRMPKGGLTAFIIGYFVEGIFQIIPFVVIGQVVKQLIRQHASKQEIYLKMSFMLIPIAISTAYWLFSHIDPFARGVLLFINLFLVLVGHLLGRVVYNFVHKQKER